jgi:hypothetical protein
MKKWYGILTNNAFGQLTWKQNIELNLRNVRDEFMNSNEVARNHVHLAGKLGTDALRNSQWLVEAGGFQSPSTTVQSVHDRGRCASIDSAVTVDPA